MQDYVREDGTCDPALRRPAISSMIVAHLHDTGLQHASDNVDETFVSNAFAQTVEDDMVRDTAEAIC